MTAASLPRIQALQGKNSSVPQLDVELTEDDIPRTDRKLGSESDVPMSEMSAAETNKRRYPLSEAESSAGEGKHVKRRGHAGGQTSGEESSDDDSLDSELAERDHRDPLRSRGFYDLLAETWLGYTSWSLIIFFIYQSYYSLLKGTGFAPEAIVGILCFLVPAPALFFKPLFKVIIAIRHHIRVLIVLGMLVSICPDWRVRFSFAFVGVWSHIWSLLGHSAVPANVEDRQVRAELARGYQRHWWGWILGLALLLASKLADLTLNPIHEYHWGLTLGCACFGVLCVLWLLWSERITKSKTAQDIEMSEVEAQKVKQRRGASEAVGKLPFALDYFFAVINGVAFGSLLWLSLWLVSSHAVILRWSLMSPKTFAYIVVAVYLLGVIVTAQLFTLGTFYVLVGLVGAGLLLYTEQIPGFIGGLLIVLIVPALWYIVASEISNLHTTYKLTITYTVGFVVFIFWYICTLGVIIGGNLSYLWEPFQGRPETVLWAVVACLFFSVLCHAWRFLHKHYGQANDADWIVVWKGIMGAQENHWRRETILMVLILILLAGGSFLSWGLQHRYSVHHRDRTGDDNNLLIAMTFNVYQGTSFKGQSNFDLVTHIIKSSKADIVALQESDSMHMFTENRDLVDYVATRTHMDAFYGLSTRDSSYGTALLSHYTLEKAEARQLGNHKARNDFVRPWLMSSIMFNNTKVHVYAAHIEFSDEVEALKQVQELLEHVNETLLWAQPGAPVIVMGDFNFNRTSAVYLTVTLSGYSDAWLDIHSNSTARPTWRERYTRDSNAIDYIFYQNLKVTNATLYDKGAYTDASDHYPLAAHFVTL